MKCNIVMRWEVLFGMEVLVPANVWFTSRVLFAFHFLFLYIFLSLIPVGLEGLDRIWCCHPGYFAFFCFHYLIQTRIVGTATGVQ